jgi:anti-sigma regulatory factor (Ser/Thr protein kinase)
MDIKSFIINNLEKFPDDIVNRAMAQFRVTRPAVFRHLNTLIDQGIVFAEGKTRSRKYHLITADKGTFSIPLSKSPGEGELWDEKIKPKAIRLPQNIQDICAYGFTEMVNNVLDHSKARTLKVTYDFSGPTLQLSIDDDGIGIFEKIKKAMGLKTHREAILHLSKGKLTTDPERHTGEGIFFTSRLFDVFALSANGLSFRCFQQEDQDWLIDDADKKNGTNVLLSIHRKSARKAIDIFNQYSASDQDYAFSKTRVIVELGRLPGETYISRSQAKRVLMGLEKFREIVLDFHRVESVGQGFVDEVFRVFQNQHPAIQINPIRMNENVEFMVKRGLG